MDAIVKLQHLAEKNNVSFEELCFYAVNKAEIEREGGHGEEESVGRGTEGENGVKVNTDIKEAEPVEVVKDSGEESPIQNKVVQETVEGN